MAVRNHFGRIVGTVAVACLISTGSLSAPPRNGEATYFERVFDAIKRNFPADFNRIAAASHGPDASTAPARMISELFQTHLHDIARAPDSNLLAVAAAEREFIIALQKHSETICATYGQTGDVSRENLPPDITGLGLEMGVRKWDAARAGIDRPVKRSLDLVAPGDAQAWVAAMRKAGATDQMLEWVAGTTPSRGVTPKELCQAHVIEISSIALMPSPSGANVAALRYSASQ